MKIQLSLLLWLDGVSDSLQDIHVACMFIIMKVHIVGILRWWGMSHVLFDTFLHYCLRNNSLKAFVSSVIEFMAFACSSLSIDINVRDCSLKVIVCEEVMIVSDKVDHGILLFLL